MFGFEITTVVALAAFVAGAVYGGEVKTFLVGVWNRSKNLLP